jgi:protein O-GlcNAc transferase
MQLKLQDAFMLAARHESSGRRADARAIYEQILDALPEHPGALLKVALQEIDEGHADAARDRLERALVAAQRQALPAQEIWLALGYAHLARADKVKARIAAESAVLLAPEGAGIMARLGQLALDSGDPRLGERCFRAALERESRHTAAASRLALALVAQHRLDEAQAAARAAIDIDPASLHAIQVLSFVALQRRDPARALQIARDGLRRHPSDVYLMHLLGNALKASGAASEARKVLAECAALAPDDAGVRVSLGAACLDDNAPVDAREQLERAIALGAQGGEVWDNLGLAYRMLGKEEHALRAFETAVARDAGLTAAVANLVYTRRRVCEWDGLEYCEGRLVATLGDPEADPRWSPFVALSVPLSSAQQLEVARLWSSQTLPAVAARAPAFVRRPGSRLRIGYLSADLHDHATAHLAAGLFERHDRSTTEICAYSYGIEDASAMRARLVRGFDRWVDIAGVSDDAAAKRIRDDGIDVLVELKGHTAGNRLGIVCRRPAPIQLHYLGFAGTLGLDAISHLVADATVIPAGEEAGYHEALLRMQHCYQVNDDRRVLRPAPARSALGLPDEAIVLACFNQTTKLSRAFFRVWAQAMREAPRSVLWLFAPYEAAQRNLRREAEREGLDPARIAFAPKVGNEAHIARLRVADLALDLLPYGSHTTGSDALWAGVPLLSCRGATFAGRVGASLLAAVGLPELVAERLEDYGVELLRLLRDAERLRGYKHYLNTERGRLPLFDTESFTRAWERMLIRLANGSS